MTLLIIFNVVFTNPQVTRRTETMEERFASLVCDLQKYFDNNPDINAQEIKLYLTNLSVSIREDTDCRVFTHHQAEIITYSTLTQVFQWLTIHGFWSFLNYYLLERLVDKYGNETLKTSVSAFKADMEQFKSNMKLVDFLPAWSGRSAHITESGFQAIILRLHKDWSGCTLADVAKMEGYLESRFLINRFIFRFANGRPGSVVIMWLVPSHVIEYIKKIAIEIGKQSLTEEEIIEVTFESNITMKVVRL